MGSIGERDQGLRLAELVATLSLAADLGLGQPAEHAIRSCLVALKLGEEIGLGPDDRATAYWVNLLAWIGCTADSHELAKLFGDDIALRAASYQVDLAGISQVGFLVRRAAAGESLMKRLTAAIALLASSGAKVERALTAHCEVTGHLATRLGVGEQVAEALAHSFTRWDGKGLPAGVGKLDIPLPARLLHLADVVVAHHRLGGVDRALTVARARSGTQFDPELVDTFCRVAADLFLELDGLSGWDQVISMEPALGGTLGQDEIDASLEVLADFADLKSPFFLGHSRGVAELVSSAAEHAGHPQADVVLSRRAALVHDIGRAGVPNTIWDKQGPLTSAEHGLVPALRPLELR